MQWHQLAGSVLALSFLFATGCVKNQLLRLETRDFSAKAATATAAAETSYIDRIHSNQQLHGLMYALDARCVPPALRDDAAQAALAKASSVAKTCLALKYKLEYKTFDAQFRSLQFVSDYVSILAETAADPELVAAKNFGQVAADFNNLTTALEGAPVADAKVGAVSDLLNALEAISRNGDSANAIREEFKRNGAAAQVQLEQLAEDLLDEKKEDNFDRKAAQEARKLAIDSDAASRLDAAGRMRILDDLYRNQQEQWQSERETERCENSPIVQKKGLTRFCSAKAAGLMYAASKAHGELSSLIADRPNARQRQRRAELAYRQFMDLVGVFVGLAAAF
ncbi:MULTISPECIES: hypothetical protein [Lysobacter]|uniref:DUF3829 domain-containing protein n=1 Tax=Lysobacter yananisis TaxID=1003114 RepID=A0ABY9P588_9GAMM|nr:MULTISPECIES: hypothetical protein [Lysobacter]QQQ03604.1 hypothetical protein JHW41_11995 [Lysobacter enzymogenes]WMT02025.1 hypothetical protein RDV84_18960 [Lysobacter yananisis]